MSAAAQPNDRLKSFIERIEKLIEERLAIQGDIKDVFSEAKGVGYDVKTMRKVIALRAMDAADRAEQEALLDTYWHALTQIDRVEARVAGGESIRTAAKAEAMPKSTAIRQVTRNRANAENGSGEVIEEEGDAPNVARDGEASADERAVSASSSPPESCGGVEGHALGSPNGESVQLEAKAEVGIKPGPQDLAAEAERLGLSAVVRDLEAKHGPQDPIWDELATVKRDLDDAVRRRVPA